MAKNRNKKLIDSPLPQAMDTSQSLPTKSSSAGSIIKIKKGVQMKRSKNVRKMKAIAKAISKGEKKEEKIVKSESKKHRTKSAKNLYD